MVNDRPDTRFKAPEVSKMDSLPEDFKPPIGFVPFDLMKKIPVGMKVTAVQGLLGEPALELGDDGWGSNCDFRWVYGHHRRGKLALDKLLLSVLDFQDQAVTGIQRIN